MRCGLLKRKKLPGNELASELLLLEDSDSDTEPSEEEVEQEEEEEERDDKK